MKNITDRCLRIQPVQNGWLVRITEDSVDYGCTSPTTGINVFITQKDLARFVEDFYSEKNDH